MAHSSKNKFLNKVPKVWKWVTAILLIMVAVFIAAGFYVDYYWKPVISRKIREGVSTATKGLYNIDFKDLHLNLLTGSIAFDSIIFKPDTAVFNKLRKTNDAPANLFDVELDALFLQNIHPLKIYFNKKLDVSSIVISKPRVKIIYNEVRAKDEPAEKKTAYEQISGFMKSVHIDGIVLEDADIKYIDQSSGRPEVTSFRGLTAKITDLTIDSASQYDKSRFYYTKDIFVQLKDHHFVTKDGLYTISLGEMSSSTSGNYLRFSKLRVKPNYPEMEFSRKYKVQHDRYNLFFNEIILNHIDFLRLNTQRRLIATSLRINGADVAVFMNRELPPVSFDKGRNYPHVVLKRLKINTRIDTVSISNTNISYSEFNPKSRRKGTVSFNRFHAVLLHVTNDSASLAANHWTRADVSAWLMNKGLMNVNVNFNLTAKNADFNFKGTIGKMDMRELNPVARGLSLAEITSGVINKADFQVFGNLRTSTGQLRIYYSNLKIAILKNDGDNNTLKKRGLISTLANALVVNNDNPGKDGKLRIGRTNATRINSASFFNLMWKSIFAGLKESVGATFEDVDKVDVKADKREQRKLKRQQRKAERKKERQKQ